MIKIIPIILLIFVTGMNFLRRGRFLKLRWNIRGLLNILFSIDFSKYRILFILIVSLVSIFIIVYSSIYIERYNKKKFLILTIIFFFSMLILSLRDGVCTTMIGWDGLGVSSICLIIIYQNSKTARNSLLTITFNRIGDVFLIIGIIKASEYFCDLSVPVSANIRNFSLAIIFAAAITKSAQFPLSTWLPAAISAPTPISAIVHSSTLVTAGVYLTIKTLKAIWLRDILWVVIVCASLSIISAGIFSIYENDLKKIIAFSTIRNIRIMIMMLRIKIKELASVHMLTHAIFKTSVFIGAGSSFIRKWRNQNLNYFKSSKKSFNRFFKVRTVMMTALPFTASFYTKDLIIEINISDGYRRLFYILVLWYITFLTIFYRKKIMERRTEKFFSEKRKIEKKGNQIIAAILAMCSIIIRKAINYVIKIFKTPILRKIECVLTAIVVMASMVYKISKSKIVITISTRIIFKTEFSILKPKELVRLYRIFDGIDKLLGEKVLWILKKRRDRKFSKSISKPLMVLAVSLILIMIA